MPAEPVRRVPGGGAAPAPFRVELRRDGDTVLVRPVGELDVATCASVRTELESAVESGCARLILDLRGLTFMDSSGLHLMVTTQGTAVERGIRFSLIRGPAIVSRALELTGLQGRFEFVVP